MEKELYEKAKMCPGFTEWEADFQSIEKESVSDQQKFFQHILLVASSTFGILISFHDTAAQCQCTRRVFLLAIILLSIGILASAVALYAVSMLNVYLEKSFLKALDRILRGKGYTRGTVRAGNKKLVQVFRICSICSYLLSIILLTVYIIMTVF
jgi:hypothetical protein